MPARVRFSRAVLASAMAVLVAVAPAVAEAPLKGSGPLLVQVGQAEGLSHIEFRWAGGARMSAKRDGRTLVLNFSRKATPDISRLQTAPPKFLQGASMSTAGGGLQITLTLTDDGDAKTGADGGVNYVNLFKKADVPAPVSSAPAGPPRPDPVPASGVVVATAVKAGPQAAITFPWKAPVGAAVFRRGESVWVVFDAKARMDVQAAKRAMPLYPAQVIDGGDFTAVRFAVPMDIPFSAAALGPNWTLILGPGAQARSLQIAIGRAAEDGPATLAANVAGTTRILQIADPAVGDTLDVATALGPAKGLLARRDYVDLAVLPSAQGLVIEPVADTLSLSTDGDVVRITKPDGLLLSPAIRPQLATAIGMPQAAAMPGLIDFEHWPATGGQGFMPRYEDLMSQVASEANRQALGDKSIGVAARMGLARFLAGSQLSYEAIGVLKMAAASHPELLANAEWRGLKGASEAMAGRYKEALADFSAPPLVDDPASSLWRGYADSKLGLWTEARQEFQNGGKALPLQTPEWRAKFARANAEASLRLNDFTTATNQITLAMAQPEVPLERLATLMVLARLIEAEGAPSRALPIYDAIARAPLDKLSAPALLHATQIRLYEGKESPDDAAATFGSLRFRWRGDSTELEIIRALGQLYLAQGRYRDALEVMRSARQRMSDLPEALQIADDLSTAFRNLFLNGQADGLEPIQALGLFYDFKELTPIGGDGDEMVRKLAQRLVNVDLLDQAALLLKYQVDSRLDGVPKAQVATDLAIIDLMAHQPEGALDALNSSRTTLLPTGLQMERRLIEARAWLQLNQMDHAAEIIGTDKSPDAVILNAEIAWRKRDWPAAGKVFEASLGDRWKIADGLLAPEDEAKLLRAAVAYSLAKDDVSLTRLQTRYQGFVEKAHWPDALRVALSGVNVEQITSANFVQAISDDQMFAGWTDKMRQRFRDRPLGGPIPAPNLKSVTTAEQIAAAAAPPPPPKAKGKAKAKAPKAAAEVAKAPKTTAPKTAEVAKTKA